MSLPFSASTCLEDNFGADRFRLSGGAGFPGLSTAGRESALLSAPSRSATSQSQASHWLLENGPKELELLLGAIVYHPSTPILIADNERKYRDASAGAGKLLGLPREEIIGRRIDDF